jgi:hypothetical protein
LNFHIPTRTNSQLKWYGIDLDGTIAESIWPQEGIGDPINLDKLQAVADAGFRPVIFTARPWSDYEAIEQWLQKYELPITKIICGKPLFHKFVDDKGINAVEESWL